MHAHSTPTSDSVVDAMQPGLEVVEALQGPTARELSLASVSMENSEGLSEERLQMIMGASLTIGFLFMLLIDQLGGGHSHSTGQQPSNWCF